MKWTAVLLVGVWVGVARGDVVHLTNGRSLEGEVVGRDGEYVYVELTAGRIAVPLHHVEEVQTRSLPHEEYAERARGTDMGEPSEVEALALWASERGLSDQSRHLQEMALGLRLEERVAAARASGDPQRFVDTYYWCRARNVARSTQAWLLEQAEGLDPGHPAVRRAAARFVEEERAAAAEAARVEALRRQARDARPSYRWTLEEEEARRERLREAAQGEAESGAGPEPVAPVTRRRGRIRVRRANAGCGNAERVTGGTILRVNPLQALPPSNRPCPNPD